MNKNSLFIDLYEEVSKIPNDDDFRMNILRDKDLLGDYYDYFREGAIARIVATLQDKENVIEALNLFIKKNVPEKENGTSIYPIESFLDRIPQQWPRNQFFDGEEYKLLKEELIFKQEELISKQKEKTITHLKNIIGDGSKKVLLSSKELNELRTIDDKEYLMDVLNNPNVCFSEIDVIGSFIGGKHINYKKISGLAELSYKEALELPQNTIISFGEWTNITVKQYAEVRKKADLLLANVKQPKKGNVEEELQAFKTVFQSLSHIVYDCRGLAKEKKFRKGASTEVPQHLYNAYGALVLNKSVCAGYAEAAEAVFNLARNGMQNCSR